MDLSFATTFNTIIPLKEKRMAFCGQCGNRLPQEGLRYCPFCGAPLEKPTRYSSVKYEIGNESEQSGLADYYPEVREEIAALINELDKMRPALTRHQFDSSKDHWSELESLVGMKAVKEQLLKYIIDYHVQSIRKHSHPDLKIVTPFNCIFKGNPGNGKTTVARIVAGILKEEGIIDKGCCVEMDASSITSGWVGFSAKFAKLAALESLGGVLFFDEAYSLLNAQGSKGSPGKEVIDTLTPLMENYRDRLIVIFAGYDKEMNELLEQTNPGFASRFKNEIHFEDYSASEMMEIFIGIAEKNYYKLTNEAVGRLRALFEIIDSKKCNNRRFANARTVRSLFEVIRSKSSQRMANESNVDFDVITLEDVAIPLEELKSIGAI